MIGASVRRVLTVWVVAAASTLSLLAAAQRAETPGAAPAAIASTAPPPSREADLASAEVLRRAMSTQVTRLGTALASCDRRSSRRSPAERGGFRRCAWRDLAHAETGGRTNARVLALIATRRAADVPCAARLRGMAGSAMALSQVARDVLDRSLAAPWMSVRGSVRALRRLVRWTRRDAGRAAGLVRACGGPTA